MPISFSTAQPSPLPPLPAEPITDPLPMAAQAALKTPPKSSDYLSLPQPVRYEEIQREAYQSTKFETFEGFRVDISKGLNPNFGLTHSIFMGNIDVPMGPGGIGPGGPSIMKSPVASYDFGATLGLDKFVLLGRMHGDGRTSARMKWDALPWCSVKCQAMAGDMEGSTQQYWDLDFKGGDWNGQLKLGNQQFFGLNYLQSVSNRVSLGAEAFWLGQQRRSGYAIAGRYASEKEFGTFQVASTGMLSMSYAQKVSEQCTLASEMMWHWLAREAKAEVCYDYQFRQARVRGKVDTEGKISALLEERIQMGVNFLLSAEIDHFKKDYKFGFGLSLGEP